MEKSLRLLIVDDDAPDRDIFMSAIAEIDENIICTEAENGNDALEFLTDVKNALPDCIFLDLQMPMMHGKLFLGQIKSNERLQHIPVFIYTGSSEPAEAKELLQMGAEHFISKPDNTQEVYYLISCALESILRVRKNVRSGSVL